jgi:hypothetical protein
MRNAFWTIALGLIVPTLGLAQTNPFAGNWVNSDANPTNLTMLYITRDANNPQAEAYLRCGANDCDLGMTDLVLFTSSPDQPATPWGFAEFDTEWGWMPVTMHLDGNYLVVDMFKWFTDDSDRPNVRTQHLMRMGPSTPIQISPGDGTVFNNYPRNTVFQWNAAQRAATYGIEVDYGFGDPDNPTWASDQGKSFIQEGLTDTTYTYSFVGAQPGRWRVWSIAANGDKSPKSSWWGFVYTQ